MIELAKEWASFPVPYAMVGHHGQISAGQSYYAGDKKNKALVGIPAVKAVLKAAKAATTAPKPVEPAPVPVLTKEEFEMAIPAIGAVLANPAVMQAIIQVIQGAVQRVSLNPSTPLSPAEVPAVSQAIATEVAKSPTVQHASNTEEHWYQKRTVWSALFAVFTPLVAALTGYTIPAEFQEAVIVAIMAVGNAIAAYLAWRAGRPGVTPLFTKKVDTEKMVMAQMLTQLRDRIDQMEAANKPKPLPVEDKAD